MDGLIADAKGFVEMIEPIGFTGVLIILAFPALRRKLGFDTDHTDAIATALKAAIADENQSPILVKSQIRRICDDIRDAKLEISQIRKKQEENLARQGAIAEDIAFIKGKLASQDY